MSVELAAVISLALLALLLAAYRKPVATAMRGLLIKKHGGQLVIVLTPRRKKRKRRK